jgi:heme exporter protein C
MSINPTVTGTGTRASRIMGIAALVGIGWLLLFGLVLSPEDVNQGDYARLLYIHVPSAWLAYLSFFVTALASALYLWKRTRSATWDRVAGASAEIGVVFTGLALITGMVWGKSVWGVYWTWDARLTSTALLFVLFLGYLAIRQLDAPPEVTAKRAAIAGLIAFVDVPIVHQSVQWWRTLHQEATVLREDLKVEMDGLMLFSLFVGVVAFSLVYVWLMLHRTRVAAMEQALVGKGLELAIAERQAEAGLVPSDASPAALVDGGR